MSRLSNSDYCWIQIHGVFFSKFIINDLEFNLTTLVCLRNFLIFFLDFRDNYLSFFSNIISLCFNIF